MFYICWMTWRRRRKEEALEPTAAGLAASLQAYLSARAARRRPIGEA
jgi:hypothetical protein